MARRKDRDPFSETVEEIRRLLPLMDTFGKTAKELRKIAQDYELNIEGDSEFVLGSSLSDAVDSRINTLIHNLARELRIDYPSTQDLVNKALGF